MRDGNEPAERPRKFAGGAGPQLRLIDGPFPKLLTSGPSPPKDGKDTKPEREKDKPSARPEPNGALPRGLRPRNYGVNQAS